MFAANTYRIRFANGDDTAALRRLSGQGCRLPLGRRVLIGELDGRTAAALSLRNGRVIADPSLPTDQLVATLRAQACAIQAYEAMPSLGARLRATHSGCPDGSNVTPLPQSRKGHAEHGSARIRRAA